IWGISVSRKPFVAGNWKMHNTRWAARDLVRELVDRLGGLDDVEVAVAPPATTLAEVSNVVHGTRLGLAAQNMHWAESGAYTGELSPLMLLDVGCRYVILGHSERREHFLESDE